MHRNTDRTPLEVWANDPRFRRDLAIVNDRLTAAAHATSGTPEAIIAPFMRRYFATDYYGAKTRITTARQDGTGPLDVETVEGAMQPFSYLDTFTPNQSPAGKRLASRVLALCVQQDDGTQRSLPLTLASVLDCQVTLPEPSSEIMSGYQSIMQLAQRITNLAATASFQALPEVTQDAVLHDALTDITSYCNLLFNDGLGTATIQQGNNVQVIDIRHISPLWHNHELSFLVIDHDDRTYRLQPIDIIDLDIGDEADDPDAEETPPEQQDVLQTLSNEHIQHAVTNIEAYVNQASDHDQRDQRIKESLRELDALVLPDFFSDGIFSFQGKCFVEDDDAGMDARHGAGNQLAGVGFTPRYVAGSWRVMLELIDANDQSIYIIPDQTTVTRLIREPADVWFSDLPDEE